MGTVVAVCHTESLQDLEGRVNSDPSKAGQVWEQMIEVIQSGTHIVVVEYSTGYN